MEIQFEKEVQVTIPRDGALGSHDFNQALHGLPIGPIIIQLPPVEFTEEDKKESKKKRVKRKSKEKDKRNNKKRPNKYRRR